MWAQENPNDLFYYQESGSKVGGKLLSRNILFTIEIQNPLHATMVQQYGH
jgi:hypothetical protein